MKNQYIKIQREDLTKKSGSDCNSYVFWDIITICDKKCFYCGARNSNDDEYWNGMVNDKTINKLLEKISWLKGLNEICLLGGEPTLSPKLIEICTRLEKFENVKTIAVYTNGEGNLGLKMINTLNKFQKISYCVAYHPSESDFEKWKENVKILKNIGADFYINILMSNSDYDKEINKLVRWLKEEKFEDSGVFINMSVPYKKENNKVINGTERYWEWVSKYEGTFKKIMKYEKEDGTIDYYDEIGVNINHITAEGCQDCYNPGINIQGVQDLNFYRQCTGHIMSDNEIKNFNKKVTCRQTLCSNTIMCRDRKL